MKAGRHIATLLIATLLVPLSHGQQPQAVPPALPVLPDITLVGTVLRSPPHLSMALLAVDGSAQALYPVGSAIATDWQIAAASADEILLRSRDGRTAKVRISAEPAGTAAPALVASAPAPAAQVLPQRSPTFPTPEMIEAAINEFNSPEND
ncbi:MAG: hypothetical protein EOO29_01735 [Comamonadaceae bacterium]|nr:MAG: hypothetical protein EOO29_01735 [Comamonadaceae bacterium]